MTAITSLEIVNGQRQDNRPRIDAHELRPYQQNALSEIRKHLAGGKRRLLLHLATGGGKTTVFSAIAKGAWAKGNPVLLVVAGRELVDNASQRLFREGVPHGVIMNNHWNVRPNELVQCASVDTLYSRRNKFQDMPPAALLIIDEAHMATSPRFRWLLAHYPGAIVLAVTATPHVKGGLRHLADEVVYPITIRQLIAQGFLVPPRYFAPTKPDLTQVKIDKKTGDYLVADLAVAMERTVLAGDLIEHYKTHAMGRPAVAFAVNVAHSQEIARQFDSQGIPALHIDANTPDDERKAALQSLASGRIKVVSNVGILTTGVDMPCVSAILMARPTKSYNLYIQIIGRGTRPYPGKTDFLVMDHAGNIEEHGLIEFERTCDLDGKTLAKRAPTATCEKCYHVWDPIAQWALENPDDFAHGKNGRDYVCRGRLPSGEICGHDNKPPAREVSEREALETDPDAKLQEIGSPDQWHAGKVKAFVDGKILTARKKGFKRGWVWYQTRDAFGIEEANKYRDHIHACVPQ